MLRALLFDLDRTLVDRDAAHRAWVCETAAPRSWDALIAADEHGYRRRDDYFAWVAEAYPELGDARSLWRGYRARLPELVEPRPAVVALLERLSRRWALGLVSNGGRQTQRRKLARAGLTPFFPHPVISAELGHAKPRAEPFLAALEALQVAPYQALFVGDDPLRDVQGAREAGLRTCWVSHGRPWPLAEPAPDGTIQDVLELEETL